MIPIIIQEPITWDKVEVPVEIVLRCGEYTQKDPYNKNNDSLAELLLLDCYWQNMGYYDNDNLLNKSIHSIPVIPYDGKQTNSRTKARTRNYR